MLDGSPFAHTLGPATRTAAADPIHLDFDLSDLISYFHHSRLPTGIQRVQIEIARTLLAGHSAGVSAGLVCFVPAINAWARMPQDRFHALAQVAARSSDTGAPDWQDAFAAFRRDLDTAPPHAFARGAWLLNLGASWSNRNHFLQLRRAKVSHGIRYVPYVHDCIPLTAPEYCPAEQSREYLDWVMGTFDHADRIIVNSEASGRDLRRVAAALGRPVPATPVVPLDADTRAEPGRSGAGNGLRAGLDAGDYVLFVSTIEPRKNHLGAFAAWLALLRRHGRARVPTLVCVGKRGWDCDAIYARLQSSPLLQQRAMIISDVTDDELAALYRHCRFTLYPSFYEGWGLPITESLCHGRVPLVAHNSSLPEAGGVFAQYFDPDSKASLIEALERLIFDAPRRAALEAGIAKGFRPRRWTDITDSFVGLVRGWDAEPPADPPWREEATRRGLWPVPMPPGRWVGLHPTADVDLWPGRTAAEALRQGDTWWQPEPWGCWTRGRLGRIAAVVDLPPGEGAVLQLGLLGLPRGECRATVRLQGIGQRRLPLGPAAHGWVSFEIPADKVAGLRAADGRVLLDIRIASDRVLDFAEVTEGRDRRVAGIGVRGLMVCAAGDAATRLRFLECAALGDFHDLEGRPADLEEYGFGRWADGPPPEPAAAPAWQADPADRRWEVRAAE